MLFRFPLRSSSVRFGTFDFRFSSCAFFPLFISFPAVEFWLHFLADFVDGCSIIVLFHFLLSSPSFVSLNTFHFLLFSVLFCRVHSLLPFSSCVFFGMFFRSSDSRSICLHISSNLWDSVTFSLKYLVIAYQSLSLWHICFPFIEFQFHFPQHYPFPIIFVLYSWSLLLSPFFGTFNSILFALPSLYLHFG